ncbi:hypothetical protein Dimus_018824 [Dionaea muscipula]
MDSTHPPKLEAPTTAEQTTIGNNSDGRSRQQRQEVGLEFFFPHLSLPPLLCFPICLVAMEAGQAAMGRQRWQRGWASGNSEGRSGGAVVLVGVVGVRGCRGCRFACGWRRGGVRRAPIAVVVADTDVCKSVT